MPLINQLVAIDSTMKAINGIHRLMLFSCGTNIIVGFLWRGSDCWYSLARVFLAIHPSSQSASQPASQRASNLDAGNLFCRNQRFSISLNPNTRSRYKGWDRLKYFMFCVTTQFARRPSIPRTPFFAQCLLAVL